MVLYDSNKRPFSLYDVFSLVGAAVYLVLLPFFIYNTSAFALLSHVEPYSGVRLTDLKSLLVVVMPIGFFYVYAVVQRFTSLTDLTILWRLFWVGPWLGLSGIMGELEIGAVLFIGSVDVGIPLLALFFTPEGKGVFRRLQAHQDQWTTSVAQRLTYVEGLIGFVAVFAVSASLAISSSHLYAESFIAAVPGLYFLFLMWCAKDDRPGVPFHAMAGRLLLIASLMVAKNFGFNPEVCTGFAVYTFMGLFVHAYTYFWEKFVKNGDWPYTRWMVVGSLGVMAVSAVWVLFSPWFSDTCSQLAGGIHQQDLIIGAFAVLVGFLLVDVVPKARIHVAIISWLLPFSAIWFTLETKMLCHLGVGSPLHPSWVERGLAPLWGQSVWVDITFWLATLFLTAIATTYTALVLLRNLPTEGWKRLSWHGIFLILLSAIWMILASSGLPAPVEELASTGSIPPLIPVDPLTAVHIHIRDLLIGIFLMGAGPLLQKRIPDSAGFASGFVFGAWALSLVPKIWLYVQ